MTDFISNNSRGTLPDAPKGRRSNAIEHDSERFRRGFVALANLALSGVQITAAACDVESEKVLFSIDDHLCVPTAGLGKILLLIETAARLTQRDSSVHGILNRTVGDSVSGFGLWQHLQVPALPVADLAALVGATHDNLATNVLIGHIGLTAVRNRAESLGLARTALLDIARDYRGPDNAPHFSLGSVRELCALFSQLAEGKIVDSATSRQVMDWLGLCSDTSLVASAFGLDPLHHRRSDHGLVLVNTTGNEKGIRAESGVLRGPKASVSYAITARFNDTQLSNRLAVLDAMRTFGMDILEYVY